MSEVASYEEIVIFWWDILYDDKASALIKGKAASLLMKYAQIEEELKPFVKECKKAYDDQRMKFNRINQKRRHDKRNDFALTFEEWNYAVEYFDSKCAYCKEEKQLTYEHHIPFSKGGSFTKENIIPVCKNCNSSRHNKEFEKWFESKDFYDKKQYFKIRSYLKLVSSYG